MLLWKDSLRQFLPPKSLHIGISSFKSFCCLKSGPIYRDLIYYLCDWEFYSIVSLFLQEIKSSRTFLGEYVFILSLDHCQDNPIVYRLLKVSADLSLIFVLAVFCFIFSLLVNLVPLLTLSINSQMIVLGPIDVYHKNIIREYSF